MAICAGLPRNFGFILFTLICITQASAQEVALTFDDLPRTGALPPGMTRVEIAKRIIETLQNARAPRVYGFVNARKLESAPEEIEVLKLWKAAGYPLANHGYSHFNLGDVKAGTYARDIAANESILSTLGPASEWHWFRYPYLEEGDTLRKRRATREYLRAAGYRVAEVSIDFEDFAWNAPYARCLSQRREERIDWLKASYLRAAERSIQNDREMARTIWGRDIKYVMLLHIGGFETVMLPQLLDLLKKQGFKLITLEEAESDPAYGSDPNVTLRHGGTFIEQMMLAKHLPIRDRTVVPMEQLRSVCQVGPARRAKHRRARKVAKSHGVGTFNDS
jgi:peptidoglycan/xylan/chitin deacetylase (PgdA/CDA1 family)